MSNTDSVQTDVADAENEVSTAEGEGLVEAADEVPKKKTPRKRKPRSSAKSREKETEASDSSDEKAVDPETKSGSDVENSDLEPEKVAIKS